MSDGRDGAAPLLAVSGVGGGYGHAPVLRDVSFTLGADQVVGVLGANGAGKSTLLRGLSGILPVCTGAIELDGRSLQRRSPWARVRAGLSLVPEGRRVFSAMTVRENLAVAALVGRGAVSDEEVFDVFPRLGERRTQLAGSLSGGEQQMLAIGRALMAAPRVLAIDEMSAGLAPVLVEQLVDALAGLRGRGMAILLVEQSPNFVSGLVDSVLLLEQGALVASGTFAELGGVDRLADLYLGVH